MVDEPSNCIMIDNRKRLSLYQSRFYRPLDSGSIETPIAVHEDWTSLIVFGLVALLSFLILNPFLSIFILSLFSLFARGHSKSTLLLLTFAFTIFYASRNIGAVLGDDVSVYVQRYQEDLNVSLASIVSRFFLAPPDNEILYFSYTWIIGNLFNAAGSETFIFIVYLCQLTLLSVIAYLVSRRYAVIFIFIFFFGMGDPNPAILHLWRANHALLVFLIGILIYFERNQTIGRIIIFTSAGFHLSLLLFIFIFELYNFFQRRSGYFLTVVFGALIFYLAGTFLEIAMQNLFPGKADIFFQDFSEERNITLVFSLIALLVANYYSKLSPVTHFVIFLFVAYFILNITYRDATPFMSRLGQLTVPIVAIPLFEIVMKQRKVLIAFVISVLFLRALLKPDFQLYTIMIPEHRNPFYGVLNILFFK